MRNGGHGKRLKGTHNVLGNTPESTDWNAYDNSLLYCLRKCFGECLKEYLSKCLGKFSDCWLILRSNIYYLTYYRLKRRIFNRKIQDEATI